MQDNHGRQLIRKCVYRLAALAIALVAWRFAGGGADAPMRAPAAKPPSRAWVQPNGAAPPAEAVGAEPFVAPQLSREPGADDNTVTPNRIQLHERPEYTVEEPDILALEVRAEGLDGKPLLEICGQRLVDPDGYIKLNSKLEPLHVAGSTMEEIGVATKRKVRAAFPDAVKVEASAKVIAQNSRVYFVIEQGVAGGQVTRLPVVGGDETIVDALVASVGTAKLADKDIWISRPTHNGQDVAIPVSWSQIANGDPTSCAQRVLSGDRVFVTARRTFLQIMLGWVIQQGHEVAALLTF